MDPCSNWFELKVNVGLTTSTYRLLAASVQYFGEGELPICKSKLENVMGMKLSALDSILDSPHGVLA